MYCPAKGKRRSWNTVDIMVSVPTVAHMSKCSVVHVFLVEHRFSNYVPYCRFVVIVVVCLYVGGAAISESDGETCSSN